MAAQIPVEGDDKWAPYEAEILKHHVDQKHTLEETRAYMESKFGFKARLGLTPGVGSQAHSRFDGLLTVPPIQH